MVGNLNLKAMKKLIYILLACHIFLLGSCDDIDTRKPFGENDGKAPGVVTIDTYVQTPGGVKIAYISPTDEDLMYIKAKYTLDTGKEMETRASLYSDTLIIEGFGNTSAKTILISAIDRYENEGEAITVEVNPGIPSFASAIELMETEATFGGISLRSTNSNGKLLYIDVLTTDENGEWYNVHTEYTTQISFGFPVRGFEAEPRDFKIVIRDIWGNTSDEYETNVTPLYEAELDGSKVRALVLPGDLKMDVFGKIEELFNGKHNWNEFNLAHSPDFFEFPVWFTFDLGAVSKISRYKCWQRLDDNGSYLYDHGNIKEWEVWGCKETPRPDGSWDGWEKLMDCESIKPSRWPIGAVSAEDIEHARYGEEFEMPVDAPEVRYIRFKIFSTHANKGLVHIQQLKFWGQASE